MAQNTISRKVLVARWERMNMNTAVEECFLNLYAAAQPPAIISDSRQSSMSFAKYSQLTNHNALRGE